MSIDASDPRRLDLSDHTQSLARPHHTDLQDDMPTCHSGIDPPYGDDHVGTKGRPSGQIAPSEPCHLPLRVTNWLLRRAVGVAQPVHAISVAQPVLSYLSATFFWCQCCWARPGCRRRSRTPTCRPTSCSSPAVACAHGTAQRHSSPSGYERRRPIRGDSRDYRGRVGLTCRRRLPDGLGRSGLICSSTRGPGSGSGWLFGAMITLLVSSRKP